MTTLPFDFNEATGPQIKVLRAALTRTFKRSTLAMMLMEDLDRDFDSEVEEGSFEEQVFSLVLSARRTGWLNDLIGKAFERHPKAPALRAALETYPLVGSASRAPLDAPPTSADDDADLPLQRLLTAAYDTDPANWSEGLNRLRRRVCLLDAGNYKATGFLVAADLVLTCDHVLDHAAIAAHPGRLTMRFDFVLEGGALAPGRAYALADDWLAARQEWTDEANFETAVRQPSLDFTILRLAERAGEERLVGGERRGWIDLPTTIVPLEAGQPLFTLHHSLAGPLAMSAGAVGAWRPKDTRFAFAADSAPGASGAPIFDSEFKLIGINELKTIDPDRARPGQSSLAIRTDLIATALCTLDLVDDTKE